MKASILALAIVLAGASTHAADVQIHIEAAHPGHAIPPSLYGIFFEDINFGADGGLVAEMVKNGSLEVPQPLLGWKSLDAEGQGDMTLSNDAPWHAANPNFLRLVANRDGSFGAANEGYRGMGVARGERYHFAAQARSLAGASAKLTVRLVAAGQTLAEAKLEVPGSEWREIKADLTPSATRNDAQLELLVAGPATLDLDMVSLCPEHTWRDRPHGLRADLVQKLADLHPAFLRFPGGCIVEGAQLKYRYQWKLTLGDLADRRLLFNRWNTEFAHRLTPDYYQSFALGFYEFFQLSEDIGAAPLPILNCGMACQFNSKELAPMEELGPYIQDALDLIEFANGAADTTWGARRAALGHPKPFGLTMIGVGNEQWGPQYFQRYELFAAALKLKHPEIQLVTGAGPFPIGSDFDFAWKRLRELPKNVVDIVDEHSYAGPDWFYREATRFDDYPRDGRRIFMGEYAAQSIDICSPDNKNNLRCALAEAAFMTGLERNSDVVAMSSYAPLFGHEQAWQWRPNLIWFDSLKSYVTPNYYVQQLFSLHRPDETVPVDIKGAPSMTLDKGCVGLGTAKASVEFKDVHVKYGDDANEVLKLVGPGISNNEVEVFRGRWDFNADVVSQSAEETGRAMFREFIYQDLGFSFKARKRSGPGGFAAYFRVTPGGSWLEWRLGGERNDRLTLISNLASHSTETNVLADAPGHIEPDRWYDVTIELKGDHVLCKLDGTVIHDLNVPALTLPQLYAVAGNKSATGELVLKVVNVGAEPVAATLDIAGAKPTAAASVVQLTGHPSDVNSLNHPDQIAPKTTTIPLDQGALNAQFPANSLSIITIPTR